MLFTTATERRARIDICQACPVYNSSTISCGMPLNTLNPFAKTVELDGVTFKPCGCFIRAKASLTLADCPAKRWPTLITDQQKAQIKELALKATQQRFIIKEDRELLNDLLKAINPDYRGLQCSTCGDEVYKNLQNILSDMDMGEVLPSQPKADDVPARIKRTRKKKS